MKVTHYTKGPDFKIKPIEIKNGQLPIKPYGGLWGSPTESENGWKDWCESEHFGDIGAQHKVALEVDTRNFITIDTVSDLDKLPWYKMGGFLEAIDFEELKRRGVDGIYLTRKGQWRTRLTFPRNLYGWDCESVLIMNERCIKKVERGYKQVERKRRPTSKVRLQFAGQQLPQPVRELRQELPGLG